MSETRSLSPAAKEALWKMREGFELWRIASSWSQPERYVLHRGPFMGGEDVKIPNDVGAQLERVHGVDDGEVILNGWAVRFRLTSAIR